MPEMTVAERELRERKAKVWAGCQAIMDKMQQGIDLDQTDRDEFDKRNKKITEIDKDLERIASFTRMDQAKQEVADTRGELPPATDADKLYEAAFIKFLQDGHTDNMSAEQRSCFRAYSTPQILNRPAPAKHYQQYEDTHGNVREVGYKGLRTADIPWSSEIRAVLDANALTTAPNSAGVSAGATGFDAGYLIPQGFWHNLQIALKQYGGMMPYLQILSTDSGQPMPWPTVDPTAIVGRYITEQNQLGFGGDSNGTDYQFGQGMLNAWTIVSGVILASVQLLNDSAFDVDGFVNDRMGESIGRKMAAEIHTGTGSAAFLGVETALSARGKQSAPALGGIYKSGTSTNWASTAGGYAFQLYQTTSSTSGEGNSIKLANGLIGFDDILGMISTVDPAYRTSGRCCFFCNDLTLAMLRGIVDGMGRPIWSPNVAVGQPDTLYGYPVVVDQNTSAVSTTASTAGGLIFGDMKTAMIGRQVNGATMLRLTERYADYLQVGYLGYVRADLRSNDLRAAALYSTNAT